MKSKNTARKVPLPFIWEDLTADEFAYAVKASKGVCLLPLGCVEKHGRHMPLSTDLILAQELCRRAAAEVPAVVAPCMPFGHVSEVRHGPGTFALSTETLMNVLRETCDEIGRNGFTKIIIVNGHGGNQPIISTLLNDRLDKRRSYALFSAFVCNSWAPGEEEAFSRRFFGLPCLPECGHADVQETPLVMAVRPETIHMERNVPKETHRLGRLAHLHDAGIKTSVDWYADYPEQIMGDPTGSTPECGEYLYALRVKKLVNAIKAIQKDTTTLKLLDQFYAAAETPLKQAHPVP